MKKDNLTEQIEEYMATQEKPEEVDEGYGKQTKNSFSRYLMDAVCECLIAVAILVLSVWVGIKTDIADKTPSDITTKQEELIEACYKVADDSRFDYMCENYDKILNDTIFLENLDDGNPYKMTTDIYDVSEDNELTYAGSLYQEFIGSKSKMCLQTKIPVKKKSTFRISNSIYPIDSDT